MGLVLALMLSVLIMFAIMKFIDGLLGGSLLGKSSTGDKTLMLLGAGCFSWAFAFLAALVIVSALGLFQ